VLSHSELWSAIDRLAERYDLSTSGLAKQAGLDPTTFNKSKRIGPDGKRRWPSTESIAKILDATGASLDEFMSLINSSPMKATRPLPLIGMKQAAGPGFFDKEGKPTGSNWDELSFPQIDDEHGFALEVSGDAMLPVFRDGDILIVSPKENMRRGDRVVVKTHQGDVTLKELRRKTGKTFELRVFGPEAEDVVLPAEEVDWIARVVWASQ
jgi:phage repressor protein C with HTH and peptisase S24 domain